MALLSLGLVMALYGGLALLLGALATYLRVRNSPAYKQLPNEIVERPPGSRILGAPEPALPEAKRDLDFALLSQAAYDQTPYGKKKKLKNVRNTETDLRSRGWSIWPLFEEGSDLAQKLDNAHLRVQVWLNKSEDAVTVTFGGTVIGNGKDWISNLRWFIPFHQDEYTLTVHAFGPAFAEEFTKNVRTQLTNPESVKLYSTGHSLGGGLAQQFAYSLPLTQSIPRVHKVFAFDPSPVTGYFSVDRAVRRENSCKLLIDRIYERGEILAYLRSIMDFFHAPSAKDPEIRQVRYNLFPTVNPFSGHSITELAAKLWDLVGAKAPTAGVWRRPRMW